MASQLIATKLHVPSLRADVVERPRLRDLLDRGWDVKLTLISAPAGFGKTTLLAEWLSRSAIEGRTVAWLSLDESDDDPPVFWPHVVAALRAAYERHGIAFPVMPGAGTPDDSFIAILLNQLTAISHPVVLVLDDFHAVTHPDIHARLATLIERLPAHVHVVISTRADPALPLPRLRARRDLVEVRAADLRMTANETSVYLNDVMGLALSRADTERLEERTEGWIAALQLAVLSLEGRADASAFIEGFAGSGRYIVDYLVEEVLHRLPGDIRRFLLETCILRRLTAALCDAVTSEPNGRAMLDRLERQNLFLVPLDEHRQWYRYHHLFADVLNSHLSGGEQMDLPAAHRRASDWFERNGERAEAIHHALAAQDFDWAAELTERAIPEMRRNRQESLFRGWMKPIPEAIIRARPKLGLAYVGVLVSLGAFEGVEDRISDAQMHLDGNDPNGSLAASAELYRSALAQVRGDLPAAAQHARRVLDLAPAEDHLARAGAAGFLGIVSWSQGDLGKAADLWTECRNGLRHAGHVADVLGTSIALADILTTQGRLAEAIAICEDAIGLATAGGRAAVRGVADIHASLTQLHLERNEIDAARVHLAQCLELGDLFGLPQHPYRSHVAQARVDMVDGNLVGALEHLHEAERLYVSDFFPYVRPIAAIVARVEIKLDRLDEAGRWAAAREVTAGDALSYAREYEHITLARLLLARGAGDAKSLKQAMVLLARLRQAASDGTRRASVIEIGIVEAMGHKLANDTAAALEALRGALEFAAPEGQTRPFLDESGALTGLLKLAVKRDIAPAFVDRLLGENSRASTAQRVDHPELIEALSEREVDVLRLLRSDMSGPDIARELAVSLNTMRTHTKNIFEKLGVNSRRAAVRRAEDMQLFGRSGN